MKPFPLPRIDPGKNPPDSFAHCAPEPGSVVGQASSLSLGLPAPDSITGRMPAGQAGSLPHYRPVHGQLRRCHAQAGIRTLLVAALCLLIGFGLGGLWHSRRAQRSAVNTETPGEDAATAVLQSVQAPVQVKPDPAIVAEVKRQIPDFASVSLEEGSQILREAAVKDLQAALSQMEGQIKEAEQRVARMEAAKSGTEKQAALKELQRLQAEQAAKLAEFTTRSSAQIETLRQMKESAR